MQDGFIKAAVLAPALRVADCGYNAGSIVTGLRRAAGAGVRMAVFPELCVTGATCGDLFAQDALLGAARRALDEIVQSSRELELLGAVGLPLAVESAVYSVAAVFCKGRLLGIVPKTYLAGRGEPGGPRQFAPAPEGVRTIFLGGEAVLFGTELLFCCRELPEFRVAFELGDDRHAIFPPSARHAAAGATVIACLGAENEGVGRTDYRRRLAAERSARFACGYLYSGAGAGESTTDLVFGGHGLIAENGAILAESPPFGAGFAQTELDMARLVGERRRRADFAPGETGSHTRAEFSLVPAETELTRPVDPTPFLPKAEPAARYESILAMQAAGLQKRLEHVGAQTVVIGVSGGLDSSLAMLVAARALDGMGRPRAGLLAVTMPCFGTTARTRTNARLLAEALGAALREVDITAAVRQHFADIGQPPDARDAAFENAQARERTQVLMDLANRENGLVVGTGDLSELALGWATYSGDHMSMYGVNACVPKTLIRRIVGHVAETAPESLGRVLLDILDTPVSPELLPAQNGEIAQKTEELVGPYELHDFFLYYAVRWGFSPRKIYRLALRAFAGRFSGETILAWEKIFFRRFFSQQFKRSCLPDGPKIGSVDLSPRGGWQMPCDAAAAVWLEELEGLAGGEKGEKQAT